MKLEILGGGASAPPPCARLCLVVTRGYNFARHEVVTSDGYLIEIHRVWHSESRNTSLLPVVIGAHFMGVSETYVLDPHSLGT